MKLPKAVTVVGLVMAVAAVVADAQLTPILTSVLGEHAATKVAAAGALLAALGRALFGATSPADQK